MNMRLMKRIDETVGPLICLVLTAYNQLNLIFARPKPRPVKRILLIKLLGMGSIIMAGPMVRALKERFPGARITMLTFDGNKEICELTGLFDEVVFVRTDGISLTIYDLLRKVLFLRGRRFDIAIDLEFFSKSSTILCYLTGARERVGYFLIQTGFILKLMWRGNLLTRSVYYNPHRHVGEVFLALARSVGADTSDMSPARIAVPDKDRSFIGRLLREEGVGGENILIAMNINAGSLCLERRWPAEKFASLAGMILGDDNVRIILTGDARDVPYVNMFLKMSKGRKGLINTAGRLDAGALAALLERARLFITNDSGPLHMAASLGVPTASFFGPETPERYGPSGDGHAVFYTRVYCSPCLNVYNQKTAPCDGKNICMQKIDERFVYNVIRERYLK